LVAAWLVAKRKLTIVEIKISQCPKGKNDLEGSDLRGQKWHRRGRENNNKRGKRD